MVGGLRFLKVADSQNTHVGKQLSIFFETSSLMPWLTTLKPRSVNSSTWFCRFVRFQPHHDRRKKILLSLPEIKMQLLSLAAQFSCIKLMNKKFRTLAPNILKSLRANWAGKATVSISLSTHSNVFLFSRSLHRRRTTNDRSFRQSYWTVWWKNTMQDQHGWGLVQVEMFSTQPNICLMVWSLLPRSSTDCG